MPPAIRADIPDVLFKGGSGFADSSERRTAFLFQYFYLQLADQPRTEIDISANRETNLEADQISVFRILLEMKRLARSKCKWRDVALVHAENPLTPYSFRGYSYQYNQRGTFP